MIYVTRHCQANPKGKPRQVTGDVTVTELGKIQSRLLGQELKKRGFKGVIFASPYYRTVLTAASVADECGLKVYPDARVQERVSSEGGNFRNGSGATIEQLRGLFPGLIADDAKLPSPWPLTKVEGRKTEHYERMKNALDAILKENPGKDVLIVTHAGAVGALTRALNERCEGKKGSGMTWNCALYQYAIDDNGKVRFVSYDISFMPEADVTANMRGSLLEQKAGKKKVKSGVDYQMQ